MTQKTAEQPTDSAELGNLNLSSEIAASLGTSKSALASLAAYQHEVDDAASRRDLGRDAIQQANEGRSQIVSQVKVVMNNPQTNLDTLAYSFSAVHYAMLVRQTIANVVEDGPLGAAGLHAQIKEAAALLHDPLAIGPALDTVVSNRIFNDITQTGAYDDPADAPLGELGRLVFRLPHKTLH